MGKINYYSYIDGRHYVYGDNDGESFIMRNKDDDTNFLTSLYYELNLNYPKFFKMDDLSKVGLLLTKILLHSMHFPIDRETTGVAFFNCDASLPTDRRFVETIRDADNFFPSPSTFVFTLPNIVSGEVCIREGFKGESSFYVLEDYDEKVIDNICCDMLDTNSVVIGAFVLSSQYPIVARADLYSKDELIDYV